MKKDDGLQTNGLNEERKWGIREERIREKE